MSAGRPGPFRVAAAALSASAAGGAAWGQSLGGAPEAPFPWARLVLALLLCIGLAVGGAFVLRLRIRGRGLTLAPPGRELELLETLRVSHQIDLCVLRFGEEKLLLAASAQGVTLVARGGSAGQAASP